MNVADVINKLFGDSNSSTQTGQGGPMMFRGPGGRGGMPETQQDSGSATSQVVVAAADSQTNTVVVTGPDAILEVVAEVVKNLDSQVPNVADVKVFHLEYADASDTADLINEVFGETGTSSRRTTSRTQQNQMVQFQRGGFPGAQQSASGRTQGSGMSDVGIAAAADSRTNAVVVSGPPTTLEIISQVIKELDQDPKQERRIFVYPLKNANASNLMEVLNNLFAEIGPEPGHHRDRPAVPGRRSPADRSATGHRRHNQQQCQRSVRGDLLRGRDRDQFAARADFDQEL